MNALDITDTMHIAMKAHAGQFRRWPKEPYSFHLARVAGLTLAHGVNTNSGHGDARKLAAQTAWLHDLVEDCAGWDHERVESMFGPEVGAGVKLLTKTGLTEVEYFGRLGDGPAWVRQIKLIDRADNLSGPFPLWEDKGYAFIEKYIPETHRLLAALEGTDPVLEQIVRDKLEIIEFLFDVAQASKYPDPERD